MAIKKSSSSGIPFGNNAGRPANPGTGQLYSNGEAQRLELYTAAGVWENIVQEVPGVSSISGVYSEQANSGVITIYGTNFVNGCYATAIGSNGVQINASSTVYNSLVQVTATFTGLSNAQEPYDIKVTNPSNLFGLIPDALYINANPIWVTSSGSLGTFNELVSVSVSATATDSDSTITYALASGSTLPSGITLNSSSGLISGTLPDIASVTTYNFTINVSDGINPSIPREFSLVSNPYSTGGTVTTSGSYRIHSFTADGTFTVPYSRQVEYLIVGGGGAGGSWTGGGGGAGGFLTGTLSAAVGSYPIVVGNGGTGTTGGSGGSTNGSNGGNSSFNSLIALGGGAGGKQNTPVASSTGGSGGGGSYGLPGASGTSGQGNSGGAGVGAACDSAGGGGGAGGAGDSGTNNINVRGSYGGVGLQSSITGISRWYAAGGQGGEYCAYPGTGFSQNGIGGTSGSQGGGADSVGTAGAINTGSGGGGGGIGTIFAGGNGGSGIVVIRYAL